MTERIDAEFVLVYFEEENKYDVVGDVYIEELCDSAAPLAVGAIVHVLWQDRGAFPAVVMGLSADKDKLLRKMERLIKRKNKALVGAAHGKTGNTSALQKKRDEELLSEIGDEAELRKENLRLNQVIDHLKEKLREKEESFDKLLELDSCLKSARKLQRHLKIPRCTCGGRLVAEEAPVTGLPAHSNGQRPTGGELLPTLNVQAPPSRDPGNEGAMSTQLKHQWSDTDVIELVPGSGIYVPKDTTSRLQQSKSATATARTLLLDVFTLQALLTCSLKGRQAKGSGKPAEQRPPLLWAGIHIH
ncbi:uncharacterized protein LOC115326046 [Ixodes scapularis]|uniref:uncharacterized protein LOC115326046 n=1 Tax=Ixodes scapularis TaxID=6945 RepID=UPI001C395389|nr:uncharacterized protein LOC115326046 [Ixodes scapularis]